MVISDSSTKTALRLYTSNRLETLAGALAEELHRPLSSPFQAEVIVVRNKGMERWLKLELAARHGICANQRFPFPEAFGHELFRAVRTGGAEPAPLDRETLTWRIMKALPVLSRKPGFASLAHYLREEGASEAPQGGRKQIQLAARIANLFDQYLVFRPAMMLEWDAGKGEGWQPELWRAISAGAADRHVAALWQRFHAALGNPEASFPGLPERVAIFGVSALPPFYLDLFAVLATRIEVNLFLLQPSREFWGEITSARETERIWRRQSEGRHTPGDLHLEAGNRLLGSMGSLGRDFLKLILEAGDWNVSEDFSEPGEDSLLHAIQSDILHLRDRGKDAATPRLELAAGDDSVQIHSCHGPLREMEVLHDHLLDWFQKDPTLTPRDIVVMTPEIEAYAPFVQAVFGAPEGKARAIPFSLADRGARRESHVIDTFLQILDLPSSRLGVVRVLALLEAEAVRAKFGLSEGDLDLVRRWVERTQIRWGADAPHRGELGLPELPGNTWRAGLDRLLLGYSMAGGGERLFADILPYDDLEGGVARVLGHFVEFTERVFDTVKELAAERPLDEWAAAFDSIVDRFFEPLDDAELERQTLREAIQPLRRQREKENAGFDAPVRLEVVLEQLRPALEEDRFAAGYLTGGVTFCGLKPMRSIPFRIVCLVGMNDGAFPRRTQHLSFDLMMKQPRLGDRSAREDDRYLFLETLLSARDRLYFSYVGQSVRDNKEAPPSVLLSELLDYVGQGFVSAPAAGSSPAASLVTRHRLQAFHEEYLRAGNSLFSYSTVNAEASQFLRRQRTAATPFVPAALGEPDPEFRNVTLDNLSAFLANPSRFFLNRRLGIYLPRGKDPLDERETFVLDGLADYRLKQELLARHAEPAAPSDFQQIQEAAGILPLGALSEATYRNVSARVDAFQALLVERRLLDWIEPLDVALEIGPFQLTGRIAPRMLRGPLLYRCANLKAADVLRGWVHHLAASILAPETQTTLVAEDQLREFHGATDARALLGQLLDFYWRGLAEPLPFFPESALAFVEAELEQAAGPRPSRRSAPPLEKARKKWEGDKYNGAKGESEEAHFELCFRGTEPLDATFEQWARSILQPALQRQKRENL